MFGCISCQLDLAQRADPGREQTPSMLNCITELDAKPFGYPLFDRDLSPLAVLPLCSRHQLIGGGAAWPVMLSSRLTPARPACLLRPLARPSIWVSRPRMIG